MSWSQTQRKCHCCDNQRGGGGGGNFANCGKFTDVGLNDFKLGDLKIVALLSVTAGQASSGEESGL